MINATAPFDVHGPTTEPPYHREADVPYVRMRVNKTFHGDLEGSSVVDMLSVGDPQSGNAGYVALEHIAGTLHGRSGSFAVLHVATATAGEPRMSLTIAPGSGTGELKGITGSCAIDVAADGAHTLRLEYELPG